VLRANNLFQGKLEIIARQEGKELATAMRILLDLKPQSANQGDRNVKITAKAKEGKQAELADVLCKVSGCKGEQSNIKVEKQGDDVVIVIPLPQGDKVGDAEGEVEKGLAAVGTKFSLELTLGSTLDDIFKQQDSDMIKALNGVQLKTSWALAYGLVQGLVDGMEAEEKVIDRKTERQVEEDFKMANLLQKVAHLTSTNELLYKQDADFGGDVPTIKAIYSSIAKFLEPSKQNMLDVNKLPDICDGISKAEISGGAAPFQLVLSFTGFEPLKLMADILKDL